MRNLDNRKIPVQRNNYNTWFKVKLTMFMSMDVPLSVKYGRMLHELMLDAIVRSPIVIPGEYNAWLSEWASKFSTNREPVLLQALCLLITEVSLLSLKGR